MLKSFVSQLFARTPDARAHYRRGIEARERGDWESAVGHCRQALRADPRHVPAWNDLGIALCAQRDYAGARSAFEQAIACDPDHLIATVNLAQLLRQELLDYSSAERLYRRALEIEPGRLDALTGLGLSLQEQGMAVAAIQCYREVLKRDSANLDARQFLLFALNLIPGEPPEAVYAEHLRWAVSAGAGQRTAAAPRAPRRAAGRIRLGFVSGDYRAHATASFLLPLLRQLDRSRFAVTCYSTVAGQDSTTALFQSLADRWCAIDSLSDEAAARRIADDGIDVLLDLSGHTLGNRLRLFALRPAPVAMSWLGYLNTTGLAAIDFRITDARADPPGASEAFHAERLLRLPDTLWCFEPPADAPPVEMRARAGVHRNERAGAQDRGDAITFGSCNHVAKLNGRVLALWGRLLDRVPDSRLLVMATPGEAARERIAAALVGCGVAENRLEFCGRLPRARYWRELMRMDIALDPFPYNGGATTCECLWMGIPVVSLAGSFGFARTGASVLGGIGLPELIARSEDEYLELASRLARNAAAIDAIRGMLRERMLASPLLDAPGFARSFETAMLQAVEPTRC